MSDNRRQLISARERFEVFERDGFRCVYCGKSAVDGVSLSVSFHLDHVYPRSRGGCDDKSNYATCCSDCNVGRSDRVISDLPPGLHDSVRLRFSSYLNRQHDNSTENQSDFLSLNPWDEHALALLLCCKSIFVDVVNAYCTDALTVESQIAQRILNIATYLHSGKPESADGEFLLLCLAEHKEPQLFELAMQVRRSFYRSGIKDVSEEKLRLEFSDAIARRAEAEQAKKHVLLLRSARLSTQEEADLLEKIVAARRRSHGLLVKECAS